MQDGKVMVVIHHGSVVLQNLVGKEEKIRISGKAVLEVVVLLGIYIV